VALAGGLLLVQGCAASVFSRTGSRDLPAFSQVNEGLYRGGQPSPEGFRQLQRMGIKTVISLRQPSAAMEKERRLVEQLGMRWVNIPMWFWWRPSDRQVHQFLRLMDDPANRPVLIHCRQGWNRAGIMAAIYRVARQGWEPKRAYAEARRLGLVPWNLLSRHLVLHEAAREYAVARLPGAQ
jgi:protein tyrosine/serine phosphatase